MVDDAASIRSWVTRSATRRSANPGINAAVTAGAIRGALDYLLQDGSDDHFGRR